MHPVCKIGDCEEGREHLSPLVSGCGVSPTARFLALSCSFVEFAVIPAEVLSFSAGVCAGRSMGTANVAGDGRVVRGRPRGRRGEILLAEPQLMCQ